METCSDLIDGVRAKKRFRSDREVGELFNCSQQAVAAARRGVMTDPLALKIAAVLGEHPGKILWMARTEREKDPKVREHLVSFLGKALASVSSSAVRALAAAAVALGISLIPAHEAQAVGGAGRFRRGVAA